MQARIRLLKSNDIDPNQLIMNGVLIGRHGRRMWMMIFDTTQKVTETTFLGNLQWLDAPVEQDFGPGVRFVLVSDPKKYIDGKMLGVAAEGVLL